MLRLVSMTIMWLLALRHSLSVEMRWFGLGIVGASMSISR